MLSSAGARVSAVACGLLVLSAFVPLPLPVHSLRLRLGAGSGVLHAERIRLTWGMGKVEAEQVELTLDGRPLAQVPAAAARLDLRFWGRWLEPRWLEIEGGRIELDAEHVRVLTGGEPAEEVPVLPLRWRRGELAWSGPELPAEVRRLRVALLEARLDPVLAQAHALLHGPSELQAEAWLEIRDSFTSWTAALAARAGTYAHTGWLPPPLRTASCTGLELLASARGSRDAAPELRLRASVAGLAMELSEPPLQLHGFQLSLDGDLAGGVVARLEGSALEVPVSARARLLGTWPDLSLVAQAETQPFEIDEAFASAARPLDRGLGEVLDALAPRGPARVRMALRWSRGAPPQYLLHCALADLQAAFRGFLEDDGERPSFPYPLERVRGDVVLAEQRVVAAVDADLGTGAANAFAAVHIGPRPAGLVVEVGVDNFAFDARVTSAAAGTPEIQEVVRLLGRPEGGSVGARIYLRRPPGAHEGVLGLSVHGRGVQLRPSFLPVPLFAEEFTVNWSPGHGRFAGSLRGLRGHAEVQGEIHALVGMREPLLTASVRATDLHPDIEERKVLEHYLQLPAGSAEIDAGGAARLLVEYRRAGAALPEVLVALEAVQLAVTVERLGLAATGVRGAGAAVQAGGRSLVVLPEAFGEAAGASIRTALVFAPEIAAERTRCLVAATGIQPTREILDSLVARARPEEPAALQPGGLCDARLEFVPGTHRWPRGVAELRPLTVRRAGALESEELAVSGRVAFDGLSASASRLQVLAQDGGLELHDFAIVADDFGVVATAQLFSAEGFVISDRFAALVSPEAWAALNRIGLRGRVGADGLRLDLELPRGGGVGFHAEGQLLLSDMSLDGPPEMERGSGQLWVDSFDWTGPGAFGGSMRLANGRVHVSRLPARDIVAEVQVTPVAITLRQLTAGTLGGVVRSFGLGPDGQAEQGAIRLGLTPDAPISALLHLDNLSLARVADELNFAAGVSGNLRGRVQLRSPTPDPLDYSGRGHLEVQDGRLGTVPVLRSLWRVLDLNPPLFRNASIDFSFGGAGNPGTVHVERLALEHPVLAVMSEGWIDMDGYVRMKATVRTFHSIPVLGFVLGLPLVRDLVDVLVEQNLFGPVDNIVISQRALRGGGDDRRHPFPLWKPDIPQPGWQRSPVLPASGRPGGETD